MDSEEWFHKHGDVTVSEIHSFNTGTDHHMRDLTTTGIG